MNEKISKYMTPSPHCVNSDLPLKKARELMRTHGIRHLPVQLAGHLVGVITDRDLKLAEVAGAMAAHKYGCAVVQAASGKVVGIFTAVDGLRLLGSPPGSAPKKTAAKTPKRKGVRK